MHARHLAGLLRAVPTSAPGNGGSPMVRSRIMSKQKEKGKQAHSCVFWRKQAPTPHRQALLWPEFIGGNPDQTKDVMVPNGGVSLMRTLTAAFFVLMAIPVPGKAKDQSGILHRVSCTVVRLYVAKYSAPAAESWARSHGATDAEIEAARRCLANSPTQTAAVGQAGQ